MSASVVSGTLSAGASVGWRQSVANTGYQATTQGPDNLSATFTPSTTTYGEVLITEGTIVAAANTTIDFYALTTLLRESKTITKLLGFLIKASAASTGAQLKIEPGASNPLSWALAGTTPSLTLDVGTTGCAFMVVNGATWTVSATVRNLKLSNPGSVTLTYDIAGICGE